MIRPRGMIWHEWLLLNGWKPINPAGMDTFRHEWEDKDGQVYDFYRAREIQESRDAE